MRMLLMQNTDPKQSCLEVSQPSQKRQFTYSLLHRKHLLKQLRPYSCIFEECTHCQTTFESKLSWTEHLEIDHAFDPGWKSFPCPLCQLETGSGRQNVSNHIARHLEEIALAALPISMYSEDEIAPESDASDPSVNDLFPDLPVIDPILKQPRSKGMDIREMPNNELQNRKNQSMHTAQPINYDPLSGEPCDSYRCSCGEVRQSPLRESFIFEY